MFEVYRQFFHKKTNENKQVGSIFPLIQNGKIGYPRVEVLKDSEGINYKNGSRYNKLYPDDIFVINRIVCFSLRLAEMLHARGKARQLELDFNKGGING